MRGGSYVIHKGCRNKDTGEVLTLFPVLEADTLILHKNFPKYISLRYRRLFI